MVTPSRKATWGTESFEMSRLSWYSVRKNLRVCCRWVVKTPWHPPLHSAGATFSTGIQGRGNAPAPADARPRPQRQASRQRVAAAPPLPQQHHLLDVASGTKGLAPAALQASRLSGMGAPPLQEMAGAWTCSPHPGSPCCPTIHKAPLALSRMHETRGSASQRRYSCSRRSTIAVLRELSARGRLSSATATAPAGPCTSPSTCGRQHGVSGGRYKRWRVGQAGRAGRLRECAAAAPPRIPCSSKRLSSLLVVSGRVAGQVV